MKAGRVLLGCMVAPAIVPACWFVRALPQHSSAPIADLAILSLLTFAPAAYIVASCAILVLWPSAFSWSLSTSAYLVLTGILLGFLTALLAQAMVTHFKLSTGDYLTMVFGGAIGTMLFATIVGQALNHERHV